MSTMAPHTLRPRGFTLVEALVALAVMALVLAAGQKTASSLTRTSERQEDLLWGQLCAENALVRWRLARQLPGLGEHTSACEQADGRYELRLLVQTTPNPAFRRLRATVWRDGVPVLTLSTVQGQY